MHVDASTPAACELGGLEFCAPRTQPQCLYLIGADSARVPEGCPTIYQGHHGDIGARRATIILPSTAYSEKNGTYISLYHSIQQTKAAVQHCGEARDDCKIIQALADILFRPSLVDSLLEITWPSSFSVSDVVCGSLTQCLTLQATPAHSVNRWVFAPRTQTPFAHDLTLENP